MVLIKVVLLIWYSNKNFGFRKIESYLASKFEFEIWKCPIFASSASYCLTRYEQILSGCSLGCKSAWKFTCLLIKFHNRGHTTEHGLKAIQLKIWHNIYLKKLLKSINFYAWSKKNFRSKLINLLTLSFSSYSIYKDNKQLF